MEWNMDGSSETFGPSSTKRNTWAYKSMPTHTTSCKCFVHIHTCKSVELRMQQQQLNCAHCTRAHAFDIEWNIAENSSQFKVQRPQPRITFITRRLHHIVRHSLYILCYRFHYKAHIHKHPDPMAGVNVCFSERSIALRCRICWRQLESIS